MLLARSSINPAFLAFADARQTELSAWLCLDCPELWLCSKRMRLDRSGKNGSGWLTCKCMQDQWQKILCCRHVCPQHQVHEGILSLFFSSCLPESADTNQFLFHAAAQARTVSFCAGQRESSQRPLLDAADNDGKERLPVFCGKAGSEMGGCGTMND